jgi:hypothetical protein
MPFTMPDINVKMKNYRNLLLITLLVFTALLFTQKINFTVSDLGRHIKNGETVLKGINHLSTNFYSYTEPQYPTTTHHWGAGIIYYLIWKMAGFKALTWLNILLILPALFFFYKSSRYHAPFSIVFLFSFLSLPLIAYRAEVRPETFSYLFFGIELYLWTRFNNKRANAWLFYIIPFIQAFWVNIHIFFIFGLLLTCIYSLYFLILKENKPFRMGVTILLLSVAASFISPYGYKAFLEPFRIFREYGYMVAENQSLHFMQIRFPGTETYVYFQILFGIGLATFILLVIRKQWLRILPQMLIFLVFSTFAWNMVRGIAFFGFISIPVLSGNVQELLLLIKKPAKRIFQWLSVPVYLIILILILTRNPLFIPQKQLLGSGVLEGSNASAMFYKNNHLHGPVFNNYDIGSYLIFHLFPGERVFTDNRPEAYPVSFFRDVYIPMQQNDTIWEEMSQLYKINVIYFYRLDNTPWGQPFLIKRVHDPSWTPVYVDAFTLILLKRNAENQPVILKYELPQAMFGISD